MAGVLLEQEKEGRPATLAPAKLKGLYRAVMRLGEDVDGCGWETADALRADAGDMAAFYAVKDSSVWEGRLSSAWRTAWNW